MRWNLEVMSLQSIFEAKLRTILESIFEAKLRTIVKSISEAKLRTIVKSISEAELRTILKSISEAKLRTKKVEESHMLDELLWQHSCCGLYCHHSF